ncbi:hypothetical protein BV20DRAFT_416049 [Pilatotrama ljubarskyi]|nr:hypothetical protein BV20DRAFT_416049 [Pilatotrama ljubarskyi]
MKVDLTYLKQATSDPLYPDITPSYALSCELFLSQHFHLGPSNWLEFKLAIETVFRVKGLPLAHLKHTERPHAFIADKEEQERWKADDELCKAIILLNVRSDHVPFAELEHEQWTAAEVWDMLLRRDLEIQTDVLKKWCWLVRVYMALIGPTCVLFLLLVYWLQTAYRTPARPLVTAHPTWDSYRC